jgi:hypothetical protein
MILGSLKAKLEEASLSVFRLFLKEHMKSNFTLNLAGPKPNKLQLAITLSYVIESLCSSGHWEHNRRALLYMYLICYRCKMRKSNL